VHLRDRGARDRDHVELAEDLGVRALVGLVQGLDHALARYRRHVVLQLRELVGDVLGNEVAPDRKELAELHEDRTERLERAPQPLPARGGSVAPEEENAEEKADQSAARTTNEFVEAVLADRVDDADDAEDAHATGDFTRPLNGVRFNFDAGA
jgi:hypothetical protein